MAAPTAVARFHSLVEHSPRPLPTDNPGMPILATVAACALALTCPPTASADHVVELSMRDTKGMNTSVELRCEPSGGSHPAADEACGKLGAVGGDFGSLPTVSRQCILMYAPVDVTAKGVWAGEPVEFAASYANRCVAAAQTNGVFDF